MKKYENNDGTLKAIVDLFRPLGCWDGRYCVSFYALGWMDNDYRGTHGTGMKVYETEQKAIEAAKRYIKKWDK